MAGAVDRTTSQIETFTFKERLFLETSRRSQIFSDVITLSAMVRGGESGGGGNTEVAQSVTRREQKKSTARARVLARECMKSPFCFG